MSKFQVAVGPYQGPLDLLLYLIRQHELDVLDVPLAPLAEQFASAMLEQGVWDVGATADFLEMVGILVELKAERLIPNSEEQIDEASIEQRENLVRRLLEYKRYRMAAIELEQLRVAWSRRSPRVARSQALEKEEVFAEVELWDLVAAFAHMTRENLHPPATTIAKDEAPVQLSMDRIRKSLSQSGRTSLKDLLSAHPTRQELVGCFLAILELVRSGEIAAEQTVAFGEIYLIRNAT